LIKIAFTGHRPDKLSCGYSYDNEEALKLINFLSEEMLLKCYELNNPVTIISGGALGIDQLVILATSSLLNKNCDKRFKLLPLIIAEPFDGFWIKWPEALQNFYLNTLKNCATKIEIISEPPYNAFKMQKRNKWMVDNADEVWAFWDGSSGGTANCVKYAQSKNKKIINLYKKFTGEKK